MNLQWHRVHGTEPVEVFPEIRRPFLYETPVLRQDIGRYLDYDTNNALAVSLNLCRAKGTHNRTFERPDHYAELLSKQAPWFVKFLCEHTDIAEQNVPLRLGITTDMREIALPYLQACNFPDGAIDWFESREADRFLVSKYDAMWQPSLEEMERVLHLDLCFLVGSHPTQPLMPLFEDIQILWDQQDFALMNGLYNLNVKPPSSWASYLEVPSVMEMVIEVLGDPAMVDVWRSRWADFRVDGAAWGVKREMLQSKAFKRDMDAYLRIHDEMALSLYMFLANLRADKVCDLTEAFNWHQNGFHTEPYVDRNFWAERDMDADLWASLHVQPEIGALAPPLPSPKPVPINQPRSFPPFPLENATTTKNRVVAFFKDFLTNDPDQELGQETCTKPAFFHTFDEIKLAYEIAGGIHDAEGIEGGLLQVGIYKGGTLCVKALAQHDFKRHTGSLVAIDAYPNFNETFNESNWLRARDNLRRDRLDMNVVMMSWDAVNAVAFVDKSFRAVFLDELNTYEVTRQLLDTVYPKIVNGGWLILHDYYEGNSSVPAINDFIDTHTDAVDIYFQPFSTLCIQKRGTDDLASSE